MIPKAKKPTALEAALNDSPLKKLDWRAMKRARSAVIAVRQPSPRSIRSYAARDPFRA